MQLSNSSSSESLSASSIEPNSKPTLLFVNDNITILNVLAEGLEDYFYVTVADCGMDALNFIAQKPKNYFDVMILDINMPIMDGFELCEKISADFIGNTLSSLMNLSELKKQMTLNKDAEAEHMP